MDWSSRMLFSRVADAGEVGLIPLASEDLLDAASLRTNIDRFTGTNVPVSAISVIRDRERGASLTVARS